MDQLRHLGWSDELQAKWEAMGTAGLQPARVMADFGTSLKVAMPDLYTAELSGKLAHLSQREHVPKVGDWVAVQLSDNGHAVIQSVVPRRSELARKVAGHRTLKQVIAANIDIAFVLLALDNDFSPARLKRFLYQLSASNIEPVIVLNKADKTNDLSRFTEQIKSLGLTTIVSTATSGAGVDVIKQHITPGSTAILLGSSGVGKSTLTNHLLGYDAQKTNTIRNSDSTGKHTTVHRELFILPNGGLLIDTPGIRELQLWGTEEELDDNFDDIASLIRQCKYTTCRHEAEAGCAVRPALEDGRLSAEHYDSYRKMKAELSNLKERAIVRDRQKNKKSSRKILRQSREDIRDMREAAD